MQWNNGNGRDFEHGDFWVNMAMAQIYEDYGVVARPKPKPLNKFGQNFTVGTSFETVGEFQGSTANETYVSTNIIDSISSSNELADVGLTITIEGHTLDSDGNATFRVQNVTLDGTDARTKVALTTPLARASRAKVASSGTFNSPQATPTGTIYIYDDTGGQTNGVPTDATGTKLLILAGNTQSEKAATTISSVDYWCITGWNVGVGEGTPTANTIRARMETRDIKNGGVWLPKGNDMVLTVGASNPSAPRFFPYRIIPANSDWRIRAEADSGTAPVFAEAEGFLATSDQTQL